MDIVWVADYGAERDVFILIVAKVFLKCRGARRVFGSAFCMRISNTEPENVKAIYS